MDLLCALDILGGRAVRLLRGDFARRDDFGDPEELATFYLERGARWLHVVDLDAARTGHPANAGAVRAVLEAAHARGASVEIGGGLRTEADVERAVAAGADRVVLGTAAVASPAFALRCAERWPGRVGVALDVRRADGRLELAVQGWTAAGPSGPDSLLTALGAASPPAAFVVTAVDRDGTLEGPDTALLAAVADATEVPVVASGGVGAAFHLRLLAGLRSPASGRRLAGVVVGRALVDGTIGVEEALAACAASG